ncbi:putative phytanoyl-CoA dioxygenase domain-containing protein [Clavispora lusitaniae]|uniref:Phytanoyl-CoA dioxygenase domain-containing protein n=1 Tax=Clavispora lusitaniae TaxID=36911 RepID=A0ACD0WQT0_CLALS|nr:putative phytanoyl-CoA dioxygenase domain-containing protein [Clavispora lusitaniae]QFZ35231.1 putative phytanoyl-CoA dioxygenase domain-containing protein [Clavispora lusitaniae]QFZ40925.1 putative phytanoyl-CoA dioxygenase domain-containing protein [Clavispora lusitaniae]QFZ46606.1 putative phytanoyl-CoA dioxygenase domain-containing protein [Clavispora lusitaniae]QFZ52271.1 putative phytanoyl-CoA dioxygenase domain-containing protein [Clavispora lusitaniae]
MIGLSPEQIETFDQEGVLCLPEFFSPQQVDQMLQRSRELLSELDLSSHPRTQFKTGDNDHIGDQYFFDSADKVSYFFDVDAFGPDGELRYSKEKAVNKIGHGLHMKDALFHRMTFDPKIKAVARSLQMTDPRVLQSMLIFKNPSVSAEARDNAVPSHTDGTFLYTKPQTAIGFWVALEDCTPENGCLSYNPGSHKTFPLTKRFVKVDGGKKGCNFIDLEHGEVPQDNDADYKFVECKAGSLVLIHNSVLHKSEKNHSAKSRYAYAFHVIDGTAEYDELNWLQIPISGGSEFSKLYEE